MNPAKSSRKSRIKKKRGVLTLDFIWCLYWRETDNIRRDGNGLGTRNCSHLLGSHAC